MLCVMLQRVLSERWFHGFISSEEAHETLSRSVPGTFLLRFSKSSLCAFALSFVDAEGVVRQALIKSSGNEVHPACLMRWAPDAFAAVAAILTRGVRLHL